MKRHLAASIIAFSMVLTPATALAATQGGTATRYYLQTSKSFYRTIFGARNTFEDGFTANLTDFQLRFAKLAGLQPIPVKEFNTLADEVTPDAVVAPAVTPTPQPTPAESVPWGIQFVLNATGLTKTSGGSDVTVALLDTGVDRDHQDLSGRIIGCSDYSQYAKAFVDDECTDENGHGTHMAGIIAADGGKDGNGIWGLAPESSLLVYKVCDAEGLCLSDDIATALKDAVDNGANIIVLGLGGEEASSFIDDAIAYAAAHDVMVLAAAGNDGPYDNSLDFPARNPQVVSVGALAGDRSVAEFSSRGTNQDSDTYSADAGDIELVAPGVNVESTFKDNSYAILSGTSMSVAHVAGLAALQWQAETEHPAEETRVKLHLEAIDVDGVGDDNASGFGVPLR